MHLARRFPTDGVEGDRVYGYGGQENMQYVQLQQSIVMTEGIRFVDPQALRSRRPGGGSEPEEYRYVAPSTDGGIDQTASQ